MVKKGNAHSNSFERNSSGDDVASSESAGTPLKKGALKPETSTTPETSDRDKDSIHNSDCPGQLNNSSTKKPHKNGGAEHFKKSAGHKDTKITKGRSATVGGSVTKVTSSMSEEASIAMENPWQDPARDVDERIFGEAKEHVDRMTNAENSNGVSIRHLKEFEDISFMAKKGNAHSNSFERNGDVVASSESSGTPLKRGSLKPETSTTPETSVRDKDSIHNSDCPGQLNNSSRKKTHKNGDAEHCKSAEHRDTKITKGKSATVGGSVTKVTSSMSEEASIAMENAWQYPAREADERIFGEAKEHVDRMTNAENSNGGIRHLKEFEDIGFMAKKGNEHSNSFERNSSGDVASSESAGTPLKKGFLNPEMSTTPKTSGRDKDSIQNSDCPEQVNNSSRKKPHKNGGAEHCKKSAGHRDTKITKGRSATIGDSVTKVTSSMSEEASIAMENAWQDPARDVDEKIFGEAKEHVDGMTNAENSNRESPNLSQDSSSSYSGPQHHVENGKDDNSQHIDENENDKNRISQAFVWFKQASEWIQQPKHLLIELAAVARQAKDSMASRFQHSRPIVYKWILYLGKLSLLFLILWLDYSLRGLGSLLRLGTTAFFVVFWCSFLSTIAMAGFLTVLLSVGTVSIVAFFLGYTAAISTISIFGIVVLWMYGSFWMTSSVMIVAGLTFALSREHLALLTTIVYSIYCAKCHVGWLGIILCMNLAFICSDILIYFMKSSANGSMGQGFNEEARGTKGATRNFTTGSGYYGPSGEQGNFASQRSFGENSQTVESEDSHRGPSTSGLGGGDQTSAEEVIRLLDSSDHYAVLGFSRYENIEAAVLKREYRKKAMLVHPDKNIGNVKAEEAFKKLQNAYEVLLDSVKRKVYDEELRREELISCFRRFQSGAQRNCRYGSFKHGYTNSEDKERDCPADSRRITCKKCNDSHVWIQTERTKARARWCQECQDYHQARDGDGWVEQSSHAFLFGMIRKVDTPRAYACVESKIYDATEWLICQGMKCPPNTHKPTFHVNTTIVGKSTTRGGGSNHKTGNNGGMPTNLDENMTEDEFFEWLQNAMASGMFDTDNIIPENAGMKTGNNAKNSKKKRKGKKQW